MPNEFVKELASGRLAPILLASGKQSELFNLDSLQVTEFSQRFAEKHLTPCELK